MENTLYIVIPLYNEQDWIVKNLESFLLQSNLNFHIIVVDNNSTDNSVKNIKEFIEGKKKTFPSIVNLIEIISEKQKGTGAACDTGFRYAISKGANYIARIDSDCVPEKNWVKKIMKYFIDDNYEFIGSLVLPLKDKYYKLRYSLWGFSNDFGATLALRCQFRGKQYMYSYKHIVGCGMAITADLYERVGGFPRTKIEDVHEDFELSQKVRLVTKRAKKSYSLKTYTSMRRLSVYGFRKFQDYYTRKYKPESAHVR